MLTNSHCEVEIENKNVEEVVVAGDGSWEVIHKNKFVFSVDVNQGLVENCLGSFLISVGGIMNEDKKSNMQMQQKNENARLYNG